MTATDDGDENEGPSQAQQVLAGYMDRGAPPPSSWQRTQCCGSSRYLYCEMCCRLLVPPEESPNAHDFPLPFNIHIILDDRRASSTGVQLKSLMNGCDKHEGNESSQRIQLFDADRDETPCYDGKMDGVYVLFPGEGSIALSSVVNHPDLNQRISTLVVLDCKWSKSKSQHHPALSKIRKVSLDYPPDKSFYWRWHNHGPGMLSSIEAIYFAAWQITASLGWTLDERKRLVNLLWLFRLQRCLIENKYKSNQVQGINPYVPFSEEAKAFARNLRRNQKCVSGEDHAAE